ncbi:hypothetical protein ACHQM5_019753 [Ranunculus cassubicifolius]
MATKTFCVMLVALVALPSIVLATDYIVGDKAGWTIGFDYQAWARGKEFLVGDRLIFRYPVGAHNVFKVNGTSFQNCVVPPAIEAFTTGYDIIPLATEGRKWYICGVGKHCSSGGMKLFIEVYKSVIPRYTIPAYAPSSAPVIPRYMIPGYAASPSIVTEPPMGYPTPASSPETPC